MLLNPRSFQLARIPDKGRDEPNSSYFVCTQPLDDQLAAVKRARRMLLVHQAGSVRVGEVVRYTITYTPSEDRILPSPSNLHVKIKNTSAVPLRAAYLHGPYNIHVAAYPSTFDPNKKAEAPKKYGVPQFEPNLKAGGTWTARIRVPEEMRETGGRAPIQQSSGDEPRSLTWIVEIASQILFSATASVGYELLIARDERSLDLGTLTVSGNGHGEPGQIQDHQSGKRKKDGHNSAHTRGVYSKAVKLLVHDTAKLWNTPSLQDYDAESHGDRNSIDHGATAKIGSDRPSKKRQNIHLVIITHGLHSNTGADMLYLKESIDSAAKQAREDARQRRTARKSKTTETTSPSAGASNIAQDNKDSHVPSIHKQEGFEDGNDHADDEEDDDEEQVIVKGFHGNAVRTERGIQYLGKRLAKYVLELTYPDQPYLPVKKSVSRRISNSFSPTKDQNEGPPAHAGSSVYQYNTQGEERGYKFTSISFVGHSLGGLVQTYAIAYIHKHSPHFFENIKPVNFITLASPLLGLSNENPMYVKFALDFGLVGRTGQDLGLTWRAPTLARSGWSAMVGGFGVGGQKDSTQEDPGSKPLLRILPTGPAHQVLKMFRNRTVYSNVVNDGIVPLRTSCLLFLDWRGLDKVEKARRENGLIGTVAGWGWDQLTGQNTSPSPSILDLADYEEQVSKPHSGDQSPTFSGDDTVVPQPAEDLTNQDDAAEAAAQPLAHQFLENQKHGPADQLKADSTSKHSTSTLSGILNFFRPNSSSSKDSRVYKRSQTIKISGPDTTVPDSDLASTQSDASTSTSSQRPTASRGDSIMGDSSGLLAPPKTTIFESAGDLLNPPVPPLSWIIDPVSRPRTIFHDRIYHPEDIPPPMAKRPSRFGRSFSSDNTVSTIRSDSSTEDSGGMRVEEKIARAYHKDLSWRKVLVRLEPDAHNNIIVRRMFANAYGWPVVKHLCDTHFANTFSARTRDELEPANDRAKKLKTGVGENGNEVVGQTDFSTPKRTNSEAREASDGLAPLRSPMSDSDSPKHLRRSESSIWDDMYFEGTSDDDDEEVDNRYAFQKFLSPQPRHKRHRSEDRHQRGTSQAEIHSFLNASAPRIEGHRGLGPSSEPLSRSPPDADSFQEFNGQDSTLQVSQSPMSPRGNLTNIGLRRSFESPVGHSRPSTSQQLTGGGENVLEQVTKLTLSQDHTHNDGRA